MNKYAPFPQILLFVNETNSTGSQLLALLQEVSYFSVLALALTFHALTTPTISTKSLNLTEVMRDFSPLAPISTGDLKNHHAPNVHLIL